MPFCCSSGANWEISKAASDCRASSNTSPINFFLGKPVLNPQLPSTDSPAPLPHQMGVISCLGKSHRQDGCSGRLATAVSLVHWHGR
eukprot:3521478-Amphidinium_carterae.1